MSTLGLTFSVQDYTGPLDLLLHLIRQQKIDIYDIPIAQITSQYLDYIHHNAVLALDSAGDYLVLASTLMAIKSKMLLPNNPLTEETDDATEDPREGLVNQLLIYESYQKAAVILRQMADKRALSFDRPPQAPPSDTVQPLAPGLLTIDALRLTMERIWQREQRPKFPQRTIPLEKHVIGTQIKRVRQFLRAVGAKRAVHFERLLSTTPSVDEVVTTFLAVLEMLKDEEITCTQESFGAPLFVQWRSAQNVAKGMIS
ncbi:MAG: segregation/condensation protein A [Schleiferilactobacillus perolens]|jgi:segregation and condensation protein A|uniref:Segregation and condensation protein A n=1 Tax=Schleiferilactobacillus perolens DSM 12744 TaxID=1423792 RepID=A0A0R1N1L4_9LACO|nr:segregation/condensation protein A [Schleiferilactobacillus perolens]KRL14141.1 segregation and condensation protein A [Schleiferilactobacillus perolens DSM 12744]MCI1891146.1 segregation/condensation protein A [Schleiferilactobacillus harbinensis]MCI1912466.1 segregation/condensation protein A [Schleiferilactobacillus harbinensis]